MNNIEQLRALVARPSINLTGLAQEAGIGSEHLRAIIKGRRPLQGKTLEKLLPVMRSLGVDLEQ